MIGALYEGVARIARHEAAAAMAGAAIGRVTEVLSGDGTPPDHAATVELRDSGIVLPRVPVAVGAFGLSALPALDDLVVVAFMDGDSHAPVIVGGLYHADHDPPKVPADRLALHLPSGEAEPKLKAEIEGAAPKITITLGSDVTLDIDDTQVQAKAGDVTLTITTAGGGRAEIAAGGSTFTLKKDGDVTLEAMGKLTLKGTEIEVSGQAKVALKGAQVEIN